MTKHNHVITLMLAGALVLAACGSGGDNSAIRELAGAGAQIAQPTPLPQPTETPDIAPPVTPQPVVIEVTRMLPATVEVEVTREVVQVQQIIVTATPDIAGFQIAPAIDESVQPCPVKYWKRGRCIANDATVEAYASDVQP